MRRQADWNWHVNSTPPILLSLVKPGQAQTILIPAKNSVFGSGNVWEFWEMQQKGNLTLFLINSNIFFANIFPDETLGSQLLRSNGSFKLDEGQSKENKKRNERTKWGVMNLFIKTATDTPRVLHTRKGGHSTLCWPQAVKGNLKVSQEGITRPVTWRLNCQGINS